MALLASLVFALLTGSLAVPETCTCVPECGRVAQACCTCALLPGDDKCIFNASSSWCLEGATCTAGTCEAPSVRDSSLLGCGDASEPCCDVSWCAPGLTCASGSCVDINDGVAESSSCCVLGAPCFGADRDCDEGLVCVADVCSDQA